MSPLVLLLVCLQKIVLALPAQLFYPVLFVVSHEQLPVITAGYAMLAIGIAAILDLVEQMEQPENEDP